MKKENGKMRQEQRLYPDVVYRFNDIFQTVWQNHHMGNTGDNTEDEDVLVTPVFFSKGSRTFHWIGLDSHMWNWEEKLCSEHLTQFIKAIKDLKSSNKGLAAWELFCENQPSMKIYKESIKTINEAVCGNNTNHEQIHRAILLLYSGFHHDAQKNIEGIFYNFLTTCTNHGDVNRSAYLEGELLGGPPFKKFKPKDICSAVTSDDCKERCLVKQSVEIPIANEDLPKDLLDIFLMFVEHLLWHTSRSDGDDTFGKKIIDKNQVALLPLYDVWIENLGYGGIKAVFIVFFDKDKGEAKPRQVWLNDTFSKLRDAFQELAEEVTASAETLAASVPISPPYDLVRHFLKALVYVQDWQSAAVFNNDGTFQFGYTRTQKDTQGTWAWKEGEETDFDPYMTVPNDANHPIQERDGKRANSKRYYMWWTAGKKPTINLWSKEFLPDLSDEEVRRFGNLSIRFEFPQATHIPSEEANRCLLYQEYLRQQLDLMRMLIPKVRARRSALRNAAVSIMARNMSHNIGSHVLAAVRGDKDLKRDEDSGLKGGLKQVNRLNEHLQRRMDFIAELATVETLYAADNLLFQEILGVKVSRGVEEWLVNGEASEDISGLNVQKLLLKHISGSQKEGGDAVSAEIHVICPDDKTVEEANVSFNSGVLGWQAFYVMLENIIRNVAKHAPDPDIPDIDIYLKVLDNHDHNEFFEVRIWDRRGKANKFVKGKQGPTVVEYLTGTLAQPRFLDDDNALATKDWGMKEIYISATFLRGIALSDLESKLPKPAVIQVCAMDEHGKAEGDEKEEQSGVDGKNTYENLGFKFYLPKAKNVAIIVENVDEWWKSFDAASEKNKRTDMEKVLKESGVDFFSVGGACTNGIKIPHRYGVLLSTQATLEKERNWYGVLLSTREILEKRRSELPLDFLKKDGMEDVITQYLAKGDVKEAIQKVIQNIRSQVLAQRLGRMCSANDSTLYMEGILNNGTPCGENLNKLEESLFAKAVVFDDHGGGIKRQLKNRWRVDETNPLPPEKVKFAFYESRRTAFPQRGLFDSLLHSFGKDGFEAEAQCAALTPVLILDERFQRIAAQPASSDCQESIPPVWRNGYEQEFSMKMIWERMRVFVPQVDECNLEQPKLEEIKKYLTDNTGNLGKGAFVVVHQTIFDKLDEASEKGLANHLVAQTLKYEWINVVCSGRGVPWQLRDRDRDADYHPRFIALSALLQCLEHMPSKLHLVRLMEVTRAT